MDDKEFEELWRQGYNEGFREGGLGCGYWIMLAMTLLVFGWLIWVII